MKFYDLIIDFHLHKMQFYICIRILYYYGLYAGNRYVFENWCAIFDAESLLGWFRIAVLSTNDILFIITLINNFIIITMSHRNSVDSTGTLFFTKYADPSQCIIYFYF